MLKQKYVVFDVFWWVCHGFQTELDYQLSLQHHSNNPNTHKDINKTKDIFIVAPFSRVLSYNFTNVCVKSRSPSPLQG